ncbi:D-alanyl-D-alanine carboxypeptidase/D-alanyl-D-alanine-endopeptidase [Sinirhodobacter populi]|uniref:D-alanyl-D-alanine carboxypeptidase/D-alanyl-D-alanine-endopeptidase n=1 Tax=Paenirhodobacter populi TaxID=2306993 RepID=A0A443KMU4_9RHOB|nr:D-alanyl-D-alanine carboxypeptidase/D-alanyl-D-alanine-endopeptidase [Sinirhodobacter populi]RWR34110.1 D-alanyl-D-alanine carboxypeptidase/D-alanyl-D-alanine-endopeptidase [Sinirhodobacter populi]
MLTRRGALGALAGGAMAWTLPRAGWSQAATVRVGSVSDLLAAAQLSGEVGFAVVDPRNGKVLEAQGADRAMPPASTVKTITTLYALETLGSGWRFPTRLIATGPVSGGKIRGDLILAGGGDPTLSTDDLADMAAQLARRGITGVTGRYLVFGASLPYAEQIADDQPVYAGYNPAISGLNLNYNRVYFEWKRAASGYALSMDARGRTAVPKVYTASVAVAQRQSPLFTYKRGQGREAWTVAQGALGASGSRWLPVRDPVGYAGDVFQTLARAQGIALPTPERVGGLPQGTLLVERGSDALPVLLRDMLKYSTNLTAETVGMTATLRRGQTATRGASGSAMSAWLRGRMGGGTARLVDHSGLGTDNRIAPLEMAQAVVLLGPKAGLKGLMKPFALRDAQGRPTQAGPVQVAAKTGTLNFVSTLTGYVTAPGGRDLVFAIFTGDLKRRAQAIGVEDPPGGKAWIARSKILQSGLLERWGTLYA